MTNFSSKNPKYLLLKQRITYYQNATRKSNFINSTEMINAVATIILHREF